MTPGVQHNEVSWLERSGKFHQFKWFSPLVFSALDDSVLSALRPQICLGAAEDRVESRWVTASYDSASVDSDSLFHTPESRKIKGRQSIPSPQVENQKGDRASLRNPMGHLHLDDNMI